MGLIDRERAPRDAEQRSGAVAGGYVLSTRGRVAQRCTHLKAAVRRCGGQHRAAITARMKGWGSSGGRIGGGVL